MSPMVRFASVAVVIGAALVAWSVQSDAGHDRIRYAAGEGQAVVERLHHMGFVTWRDLDLHHRTWDVEDARRDNGRVYDLKLERGTLDLVRLEREDF